MHYRRDTKDVKLQVQEEEREQLRLVRGLALDSVVWPLHVHSRQLHPSLGRLSSSTPHR